jgi:hypothetical protein
MQVGTKLGVSLPGTLAACEVFLDPGEQDTVASDLPRMDVAVPRCHAYRLPMVSVCTNVYSSFQDHGRRAPSSR